MLPSQKIQLYYLIIKYILQMGFLNKIINLLLILRIFYYHSFLAVFKMLIGKVKDAHAQWAKLTFQYLKVQKHQCENSHGLHEGKIMVFANHRSQGDFFLHNVITNFKTNFLSRMGVLIASPLFILSYKTVWFFNRGNKTNPEKFNLWLDKKFRESPRPGFLVYPEGHRMQGSKDVQPSQLKTGMLKYAYRRKIPAQILISFGNQQIFDEKRLHLSWGQSVYYKITEVIRAEEFKSQQEYIKYVRQKFCENFKEVYRLYLEKKQVAKKIK